MTTQSATRPATPVANPERLADLLGHATFVVMAVLTRVAAERDLSLSQLRLLAILRDRQVRMSALAAYLDLDKSSMTGLVDRAQHRGLVTRTPNAEDGRAVDVLLTDSGRDLAALLQVRVTAALETLTDRLSPPDRHRLQGLLVQLVGADQ